MHKTLQEYVNYIKENGYDEYAEDIVNLLRFAGYEDPLEMPIETARIIINSLKDSLDNEQKWDGELTW